ncbi:MAG: trypsin-like serine protease [Myxococcales bacterium]|nr:trypsin-like serine protease [Myxococcales bacterium]
MIFVGSNGIVCTGTAVADTVVVTAAHCISNTGTKTIDVNGQTIELPVFTGGTVEAFKRGQTFRISTDERVTPSAASAAQQFKQFTIQNAVIHYSWEAQIKKAGALTVRELSLGGAADLAVLTTKESLRKAFKELRFAKIDTATVHPLTTVTFVGYGCNASGTDAQGRIVFESSNTFTAEYGTSFVLTKDQTTDVLSNFYQGDLSAVASSLQKGNHLMAGSGFSLPGLCPGDSGGPVFREDSDSLIGVNSGTEYAPAANTSGSLLNRVTRLDTPEVRSFLRRQAQ